MHVIKNNFSFLAVLVIHLFVLNVYQSSGQNTISAISDIQQVNDGCLISGLVKIYDKGDKVLISGFIKGLVPFSVHGFHIHQFGNTGNYCLNAGSHYNPFSKKHGGPQDLDRHVGDLGNFHADNEGRITINATNDLVKINGPVSVIGRSFVLHERRDNYSAQPVGDAGSRIACGLIGIDSGK